MRLKRKLLQSAQPKYQPFATAVMIAGLLTFGITILLVPAMLLIRGIPFAAWSNVYAYVLTVLVPIALAGCVLALVFGLLIYSEIRKIFCVILFGIATPLCVVGFLSMIGLILGGTFLKGIDTPEGQKNILFIIALFGPLGIALYWAGEREFRKRNIGNP